MRSEMKIRKLRAELEESEQSRKYKLAKEAKYKEAKDRGAGGATSEAEEKGGGRRNSTEDSGDHRQESAKANTGESVGFLTTDRGKVAAEERAFEQKVDKE